MYNDQNTAYPGRAPKKFTDKSLHGRVRSAYLPYDDLKRAQKFYVEVFDWDMFSLPPNVLGRVPEEGAPDVCCATGPAQFGWEGAVPGFMPTMLVKRTEKDPGPFLMMEVSMDVSLEETVSKLIAAGGRFVYGNDNANDWAECAMVEDPAGNRLLLWKCPDSRTWEEPETDYDRE